ncbi:hypothetical protein LTR86_011297, partial [Recurvomyces mirabilis]
MEAATIPQRDKQQYEKHPITLAQDLHSVPQEQLFQPFNTLPYDDEIDMTYYKISDDNYFTPRRHWCFVREIVHVEHFIRLSLFVRDVEGTTIRVAFHTPQRGRELSTAALEPGNIVLVLYAHAHRFFDMSLGLRQEETTTTKASALHPAVCACDCLSRPKVLTVQLAKFLSLTESISRYVEEAKGKQCQGCDSTQSVPFKCKGCGLAWYCGK